MRTRVGVLALMALLSAACGKIKGGASDAAPGPDATTYDAAPPDPCAEGSSPTFEEGLTCLSTAFCGVFSRCFAPIDADLCTTFPFTPFGDNGNFMRYALADAIQAGRVNYDPAGVRTCLDFIEGLSCAELNEVPGEFLDHCPILSGTVADGDDCILDQECATPHALCNEVTKCGPGYCCVKGCTPPAALNETCIEGEKECEPGSYCVYDGEGYICASGDVDARCQFNGDCETENYCEDVSDSCKPEVASGAPCVQDEQCPGAETCIGNDLAPALGVGATCGRSDREGDMCDGQCFGFYCDQPDPSALGTCVPYLQEEGADCSSLRCAEFGWACDRAADQCVPRPRLGEPCNDDTDVGECGFGLFCTSEITGDPEGVCATQLPDSEPCTSPRQCDSGICDGPEGDTTCQPYPGCYE